MRPHIKERLKSISSKETSLDLQSGRLNSLPEVVLSLDKLKNLNLFENNISELPENLFKLNKLENLTISKNNFNKFPNSIFLSNSLISLIAKNNKIKHIPSQIWTLKKIDLSENSIEEFDTPKQPFTYQTLEINLRNNKISKFPSALRNCSTLKKLNLSGNKLSSIKDLDLSLLSNLEELDLSYNQLTFLPSSISNLHQLKILNIAGNKLKNLPDEIGKLENLEQLDIAGNQIQDAPIEIKSRGAKALINYYLSLNETVRLFEAKLLIVGQGNVGKTALMNRLIFNTSTKTETTEGIQITTWNTSTPASNEFRINVWDFGGQEIYHSTHQFFLTKRSLYLFVWEARSGGNNHATAFDYWLNVIKLLSQDSPTIMVLNKIDERVQTIDEKGLMKKFSNIKAFHKISAQQGTNIDALIHDTQEYISKLPLVGDVLPQVWLDIRKKLESLKKPFIYFTEYIEICNIYGLDEKKARFLSQYFHDLGVFLHFQDDSLLKYIVFLTPDWATNAVYHLIDSKTIIENFGEFSINELDCILTDYPTENHLQLVRLMEKFELCFRLIDQPDRYLIPELFSPETHELSNEFITGLKLEYRYDFMPAGILARCIVRVRSLIENNFFWKYGVILKKENTRAIIESDEFDRKIRISSIGEEKVTLLQIIKSHFEEIHRTLNCTEVPEFVPCICPKCLDAERPYFFDYNFLRKIASSPTAPKTQTCGISMQGVNTQNILQQYAFSRPTSSNNNEQLKSDLLHCCSLLLGNKSKENNSNDSLARLLRAKQYIVADQTRHGKSGLEGKDAGELDLMVYDTNNYPLSIIECLRVNSCGTDNKEIARHIDKLLGDYDTHGLSRNFIVVYAEATGFSKLWESYGNYISKLNTNSEFSYKEKFPINSFIREETQFLNIKIGTARHSREENEIEVVHFFVNMNS